MKKHGFTLTEILIVLIIIGVVVAIMIPTVKKIMPDTDTAKAKKAYNTLTNVIDELANDDNIYLNGDFGKKPDDTETDASYFCQQFADKVNISSMITCDSSTGISSSRYGFTDNTFFEKIDEKCRPKRTDKSKFAFKTTDGIYWYGMRDNFQLTLGAGNAGEPGGVDATYIIVCVDVNPDDPDIDPYAFGVRRDGRILVGKRAQDILDEDSLR